MVVSSFSTADTICSLIVSASAWLFASAVRHHRMWTPTALTMIDARTRPEIDRRIPIRMIDGASHSIFRKKRHRCRANGFASGHAYLSEHLANNQPRGSLDDLLWRSHRGHVDDMRLSASKTP